MVTFSSLVVAFFAIIGSLASPTAQRQDLSPANFILRRDNAIHRRESVNYDQNYTTGGDVLFSPDGSYYKVSWDTEDDFVVGVGWANGSTSSITFSGTFRVGSGTALLSVYGWSENPLVEYYIIEDTFNPPSFGTVKGSVSSDESEYVIYENTRIIYENGPIIGTATLNQYFSVRNSPRQSGTVTVENHFQAWANLGLHLGSLNYQIVAVEGWGGEGVATQKVSN